MNTKHITSRIEKHNSTVPKTALERSRKLKSLQVTRSKLLSVKKQAKLQIKDGESTFKDAEKNLAQIESDIQSIQDFGQETIVTEHALLRYCERILGLDLEKIHQDIINLPLTEKVISGNTIVTVFTEPTDHFNLAERESQ